MGWGGDWNQGQGVPIPKQSDDNVRLGEFLKRRGIDIKADPDDDVIEEYYKRTNQKIKEQEKPKGFLGFMRYR